MIGPKREFPSCATCWWYWQPIEESVEGAPGLPTPPSLLADDGKCTRKNTSDWITLVNTAVYGKGLPYPNAWDERDAGWIEARLLGRCGLEGRFWTPKKKADKGD